jgi:hypothetical protein
VAAENFVYNIAKGRGAELYNRVDSNDPANSALILIPLSTAGSEAQGQDFDTVSTAIDGANFIERTSGGWHRGTLTDSDLSAMTVDDTNNRMPVAVPQYTWSSVAAGNDAAGLMIAYDPDTTTGTDTTLVPITHHIFAVTTDGNNVVLNSGDFLRAS